MNEAKNLQDKKKLHSKSIKKIFNSTKWQKLIYLTKFVHLFQGEWLIEIKKTYVSIFNDDIVIGHLPIIIIVIMKCGI